MATQSVLATQPQRSSLVPVDNYGALDSVWNSYHTLAPSAGSGAYDFDPTLPMLHGQQVRYTAIFENDGRVIGFERNFPANTGINRALVIAAQDLPRDAHVIWQTKLSTKNGVCYQADFVSRTLGQLLKGDRQGQVAVVLEHQDPGGAANPLEESPDLSVITDAVFAENPGTTETQANGC